MEFRCERCGERLTYSGTAAFGAPLDEAVIEIFPCMRCRVEITSEAQGDQNRFYGRFSEREVECDE